MRRIWLVVRIQTAIRDSSQAKRMNHYDTQLRFMGGVFKLRRLRIGLFLCLCLSCRVSLAGIWTALTQLAPDSIDTMLLLSDGTVLAANGGSAWYRLTPDINGSYVNGTWTTVA